VADFRHGLSGLGQKGMLDQTRVMVAAPAPADRAREATR